jgi:hypothetical protein
MLQAVHPPGGPPSDPTMQDGLQKQLQHVTSSDKVLQITVHSVSIIASIPTIAVCQPGCYLLWGRHLAVSPSDRRSRSHHSEQIL